jgi:hypothetical protein
VWWRWLRSRPSGSPSRGTGGCGCPASCSRHALLPGRGPVAASGGQRSPGSEQDFRPGGGGTIWADRRTGLRDDDPLRLPRAGAGGGRRRGRRAVPQGGEAGPPWGRQGVAVPAGPGELTGKHAVRVPGQPRPSYSPAAHAQYLVAVTVPAGRSRTGHGAGRSSPPTGPAPAAGRPYPSHTEPHVLFRRSRWAGPAVPQS